jgi:hypothetical protein
LSHLRASGLLQSDEERSAQEYQNALYSTHKGKQKALYPA